MKKLIFLLGVASSASALFSAENVAKSGVITNTINTAEGAQVTDIHKRIKEFVDRTKKNVNPKNLPP